MGTELMIPKIDEKALTVVDEVAEECRVAMAGAGNAVSGSLVVAQAMARLRQAITPEMMTAVSALQGSAVGFKTDKDDKGGYSAQELTDPFLEATVRGFRMIGNEMNVIARRFYGAKAGFERKVRDYPGLSDWEEAFDFQETVGGTAKVQAIASWTLNGQPDQLMRMRQSVEGQPFDNRIGVRVNAGMGYDAVIGKAKRKLYAQVYDYLIGALVSTPEGEVEPPLDGAVGSPKVKRSGMFDHGPPPDSSPDRSDPAADDAMVAEYEGKLAAIRAKKDIPAIARLAGRDARLSEAAKARVFKMCTEAGKRKGSSASVPPPAEAPTEPTLTENADPQGKLL